MQQEFLIQLSFHIFQGKKLNLDFQASSLLGAIQIKDNLRAWESTKNYWVLIDATGVLSSIKFSQIFKKILNASSLTLGGC